MRRIFFMTLLYGIAGIDWAPEGPAPLYGVRFDGDGHRAADRVRDGTALFGARGEFAQSGLVDAFQPFDDGLEVRGDHLDPGVALVGRDRSGHLHALRFATLLGD